MFFVPLNLIQVQGYSATAAGAAWLPFVLIVFLLSRWSGGLVTRYGAKLPLVIGPVIAAAGYALFIIPSVGGTYWATYFPAVVVVGLGMAISVAPLTTTVMSAAAEHAGVASGVNNAISRTAGLMGIAVLGILILHSYSRELDRRLEHLPIAPDARRLVDDQRARLAGAKLPDGIDDETRLALKTVIDESFVHGFRVVMVSAVVLALAGALSAFMMIEARRAPNAARASKSRRGNRR
jgi:MFS family permease